MRITPYERVQDLQQKFSCDFQARVSSRLFLANMFIHIHAGLNLAANSTTAITGSLSNCRETGAYGFSMFIVELKERGPWLA
jgi:hypothetical protein